MTLLTRSQGIRRKAVWGPKATLAALLAVAMAFAPSAMAESGKGKHGTQGRKAKPASPHAGVKNYKLDDEVIRRSKGNPSHTTSVIVTLRPGAQLPSQFKKFVRGNRLAIINGLVLDVPNGVLEAVRVTAGDLPGSSQPSDVRLQLPHVRDGRRLDGARPVWLRRRRCRRRRHRLGHRQLARRPVRGQQLAVISVWQSARAEVRRLRERSVAAVRRQRPRHACVGHHRRQRLRLELRRKSRHRAEGGHCLVESAQREWRRDDQRHDRRDELDRAEPPDLQHPRRQHVSRCADHRNRTGPTR